MSGIGVFASLFFISFCAATILPMQSEAVLVGLLLTSDYALWLLVLVASIGNILGSVVNWLLGRGIEKFGRKRWFPIKEKSLAMAKEWYRRYGRWALFLSWMPFIGDPLTVVAGIMRERLSIFLAIVTIAKTGRYVFLTLLTKGVAAFF